MVVVGTDRAIKLQKRNKRHTSQQSDHSTTKIQCDVIAVEAHRLGILNWNVSKSTARYQVELYLQQNGDGELPWICFSQEFLQSLESTSFQFEQELIQLDIGRRFDLSGIFRVPFVKAFEQKKFCRIYATQVLQEKKFQVLAILPPDTAKDSSQGEEANEKHKQG